MLPHLLRTCGAWRGRSLFGVLGRGATVEQRRTTAKFDQELPSRRTGFSLDCRLYCSVDNYVHEAVVDWLLGEPASIEEWTNCFGDEVGRRPV